MTPCYHKFCRDCIEQLEECPLCRKEFKVEDLIDLKFTKKSTVLIEHDEYDYNPAPLQEQAATSDVQPTFNDGNYSVDANTYANQYQSQPPEPQGPPPKPAPAVPARRDKKKKKDKD